MNLTTEKKAEVVQTPLVIYKEETLTPLEKFFTNLYKKAEQYYNNLEFWGSGKRANDKREAFNHVEKEREEAAEILQQILVHPELNWRITPENEIEGIEIRLLNENQKKEIEITFPDDETATEDVNDLQITLLDEEPDLVSAINFPQGFERAENFFKEHQDFLRAQNEKIRELYSQTNLDTAVKLENHNKQTQIGQNGYYSCSAVCALNALQALNVKESTDSEASIIAAFGGPKAFSDNGYLPLGILFDFLINRNLLVYPTSNMVLLMQALEKGGVAIIAFDGHSRLISGAFTKNNEVFFRMNDPFRSTVTTISSTELVSKINLTDQYTNMYLISKPQ